MANSYIMGCARASLALASPTLGVASLITAVLTGIFAAIATTQTPLMASLMPLAASCLHPVTLALISLTGLALGCLALWYSSLHYTGIDTPAPQIYGVRVFATGPF